MTDRKTVHVSVKKGSNPTSRRDEKVAVVRVRNSKRSLSGRTGTVSRSSATERFIITADTDRGRNAMRKAMEILTKKRNESKPYWPGIDTQAVGQ